MPSRSDSKTTTAAPFALNTDPPLLVIANRLRRARAGLIVLENGYDDKERDFNTTPWVMVDALEAIDSLLGEAIAASDWLLDDEDGQEGAAQPQNQPHDLDPIFAALADAWEAQKAWEAAMKISGDLTGPAFDAAEAETVKAQKHLTKCIRQLCVTVPTSDLGLVAFLEYLAKQPSEQKRIGLEYGLLDNKRLELAYLSVITGARRLLKLDGSC